MRYITKQKCKRRDLAVYILHEIGYNIGTLREEMGDMEAAVQKTESTDDKNAMKTLFSYLDKGLDDMEAGRMHTADEAFRIIKEKMNNEL